MTDHARDDIALEVALAADAAGLCVVPPREDGSKRPDGTWRRYQTERPTRPQIEAWYANGRTGVGVICGQVSGGLEMLEFEGRAKDQWRQFVAYVDAAGHAPTLQRIIDGYAEKTPSGGVHLLYRCVEIDGNLKLARTSDGEALIETRGEGGYVILAPSCGTVHPSGQPWVRRSGSIDTIATITPAERAALHDLCRRFDQITTAPTADVAGIDEIWAQFAAPTDQPWFDHVVDDFNRSTTWHQILAPHGWAHSHRHGNIDYWTRPGKDPRHGHSATTNSKGTDRLIVFTSSAAGFDTYTGNGPATSYDRFSAHAILEHGGDRVAAARQLRADQPPTSRPATKPAPAPTTGTGQADETARTGWEPTDLTGILAAGYQPLAPDIAQRTDNVHLFYSRRVNALFGESDSGKSWVAQLATAQQLTADHDVVYIDLEDHAASLTGRLRALGVPADTILAHFTYIQPDLAYSSDAATQLEHLIAQRRPTLVVIDSVGEALAIQNQKQNDDDAVALWHRLLPKRLAAHGPAVILIDHVPKSKDAPAGYAIGSQRKKAAIDGAAYRAEQVRALGKGRDGIVKLTVAKDRNGHHPTGFTAAELHLNADPDGQHITANLHPGSPAATDGSFRPTTLMERVSDYLAANKAATKTQLKEHVRGDKTHISTAIDILIAEDYIHVERQGQTLWHSLAKPYRADLEWAENDPK